MQRIVIDNFIGTGKVKVRTADISRAAWESKQREELGKIEARLRKGTPSEGDQERAAELRRRIKEGGVRVGGEDADAPGMVHSDDLQCDVAVTTLTRKKLQEIYNDPKRPQEERNAARREFEARGMVGDGTNINYKGYMIADLPDGTFAVSKIGKGGKTIAYGVASIEVAKRAVDLEGKNAHDCGCAGSCGCGH